ncbi:unnamed protein product [Urochloa decumbens]|uniref:Knottin scorpion toxin-like domain-containing protein n=1 Tax=Urochloa decumbens TaxID=240449 RepID=A0ABC9AS59_9POAL
MESSPRKKKNLSAAAAAVLLLVILTAESSEGFGDGCNDHLSGSYRGACWPLFNDNDCGRACINESSDNLSGSCDLLQCWCHTKCDSTTLAPPST